LTAEVSVDAGVAGCIKASSEVVDSAGAAEDSDSEIRKAPRLVVVVLVEGTTESEIESLCSVVESDNVLFHVIEPSGVCAQLDSAVFTPPVVFREDEVAISNNVEVFPVPRVDGVQSETEGDSSVLLTHPQSS